MIQIKFTSIYQRNRKYNDSETLKKCVFNSYKTGAPTLIFFLNLFEAKRSKT